MVLHRITDAFNFDILLILKHNYYEKKKYQQFKA